jgi:type IV secretory pathway VirJ component
VSSRSSPVRVACALLLALAGASAACSRAPEPEPLDAGRLGRALLFRPAGAPRAFVFLVSDRGGFTPALGRAAGKLAERGTAVLGVDLDAYLRGLAASDDGCHYVVAELEALSQRLQRELGAERYRSPIVAGSGEGGTLAYAALAQAPAATLGGAVVVDPAASLGTKVPLCAGADATPAAGGGFSYAPRADLPGRLHIETSGPAGPALQAIADAAGTKLAAARGDDPGARLVAALGPLLATKPEDDSELADLPLVEVEADNPDELFAVIYSGDGGWRDLDKTIGALLAERGVPVVGVDSLRYFWQERTPEQVAADLARVLATYRERWGTPKAILVGYSFGAGILPFAFNRLPPAERDRVVQLSLLGLEPNAPFEIDVSGWLGGVDHDAPAVLPELQRLDLGRVQCFYGSDEETTLCPAPELAKAEIIRTEGGHHFDGDYDALAVRILDGARRRLGEEPKR